MPPCITGRWFIGKGYGWKESRIYDECRRGYGERSLLACFADHLSLVPDERLGKTALHTTPCAGPGGTMKEASDALRRIRLGGQE